MEGIFGRKITILFNQTFYKFYNQYYLMEKKIFDYSLDADEETLRQFKECYSQNFVVSAALMPDCHKGYAAPIGSVLITKGYIVPAWVGFDIGCGMIAVRIKGKNILEKVQDNINEIYNKVMNKIPMGVGNTNKEKNITEKTKNNFKELLKKFQMLGCISLPI